MKKNSALLLFVFIMMSCKKETKPLVFSEVNFTSEASAIIEINIPKVSADSEAANTINTTIKQVVGNSLSSYQDAIEIHSIEDAIKTFDKDYEEFSKDIPDGLQPWEAFVDGEVIYQSSEIISIALNTYKNTGGAYGNSVISFLNFNPSTGELYKQDDLIENKAAFTQLAEKQFVKTTEDNPIVFEEGFKLPENIGFSDDGVIVLFNSYELPNNDAKTIAEFTIPYNEVNSFLSIH